MDKFKYSVTNNKLTVIPAQPGYYPIYESDEGEDPFIVMEPIIAWAINKKDLYVTPITIEGEISQNITGIMNPDKSVTIFNVNTFESFDDYLKDRQIKQ